MAFNGSGTFLRLYNWVNDKAANIKVRADRMDAEMDGMATGLSTCITKDGQTTITANLPMANFRHTGVGNASARTDYAAAGQVQDGKLNWVAAGGTADAITATYSPAITALVDGQICHVRAGFANTTTTPTFAPNGLTARTITKNGNQALVAGDIYGSGHELILRYRLSDTKWELLNPVYPFVPSLAPFVDSTAIIKGSADATKLLRIEVDGFTTGTTRVMTPPNEDFTVVGVATVQTLTNKTLTNAIVGTQSAGDNSTKAASTAYADAAVAAAAIKVAKYTYDVASGTNGGTPTAGAWTTRPVNTELYDDIGLTLTSNAISLPAGTYNISANMVFGSTDANFTSVKGRLRNTTDSSDAGLFMTGLQPVGGSTNTANYILSMNKERVVLAGTKTFELQYYISAARTNAGLGQAYSAPATTERYVEWIIEKIA